MWMIRVFVCIMDELVVDLFDQFIRTCKYDILLSSVICPYKLVGLYINTQVLKENSQYNGTKLVRDIHGYIWRTLLLPAITDFIFDLQNVGFSVENKGRSNFLQKVSDTIYIFLLNNEHNQVHVRT